MKWVYAIKYKLQAALILTIIVFLVFVKNILDKRNMTELGKDFISFYDDRLVVVVLREPGHIPHGCPRAVRRFVGERSRAVEVEQGLIERALPLHALRHRVVGALRGRPQDVRGREP